MICLKPNGSNITSRKKNGIHSKPSEKVESNVPLKHFLEFIIFHSSHSNPHYIKLKASLPTYSEFIFL